MITTTQQHRVHPTAEIEAAVSIGPGTAIWDNVHVRAGAQIGRDCIIGEKSYIGPGVHIGDRVKINAFVYVPTGVTIDDGVMISAGTIFTNDRFPRATTPDLARLRDSGPGEDTLSTRVREGATIGAGSIVGCGLEIGRFAMTGMGSVVTRSVPDFNLVIGTPAASHGFVCRCGQLLATGVDIATVDAIDLECRTCHRTYSVAGRLVTESDR